MARPARVLLPGVDHLAATWRPVGLTALAGAALLASVLARPVAPPPVRVAIRVACTTADACARAEAVAVDVWSEARGPQLPLDVVVPSTALPGLAAAGVAYEVLVPDIDAVARIEAARLRDPAAARPGDDWFADYKDYEAITAHLRELASIAPGQGAPGQVSMESIGRSIEGRPLWALRIGGTAPGAVPMLVNGTQHAREWITSMVTTCVADRLIRGYARDPEIRAFVDRTELWVVPVANPDGYQHSWGSNRYWRKNRRGTHGVDLNRNFGVAWGGRGASKSERSETYAGTAAFSEPESRALRDLVQREAVALHLDVHSYGQLILYPWNYTTTSAPDRARLAAIGERIGAAMAAPHGTRYTLQPGAALYPAAGTMTDWAYGEAKALSYTLELRPKGGSGFVLPPAQIRPTCDEGLGAVMALRAAVP